MDGHGHFGEIRQKSTKLHNLFQQAFYYVYSPQYHNGLNFKDILMILWLTNSNICDIKIVVSLD